jgi:hypothetical protein
LVLMKFVKPFSFKSLFIEDLQGHSAPYSATSIIKYIRFSNTDSLGRKKVTVYICQIINIVVIFFTNITILNK